MESEAINVLNMIEAHGDLAIKAKQTAINALEEVQQYRAIGTLEELKEAMKYVWLVKKQGHIKILGIWDEVENKDVFTNDIKDAILKLIDAQPTAYDPDKVVEQLENLKSLVPVNRVLDDIINDKPKELGMLIAYEKAIEIVKGGGVDGN